MGKSKTKKVMAKKIKTFIKKNKWQVLSLSLAAVLVIIVLILLMSNKQPEQPEETREVITVSTLEKIINVSELSTFTAVYNGISQVANEEEPEKIDYYVSYEAKVKAGIDVSKIAVTVDDEAKTINMLLPEVNITDINVAMESLDFMFLNDKANASAVSAEAYKACEEDVERESRTQEAIFVLAKQNAENTVKALVNPILEQLDAEYGLVLEWEGY